MVVVRVTVLFYGHTLQDSLKIWEHLTVVGMTGFEPATSRSRTVRSTNLSYIPMSSDKW